jgi:hypothetical protein
VLRPLGRRDEVVELKDREVPFAAGDAHAGDLQLGLVDGDHVRPADDPVVRGDPRLEDQRAAGLLVARHRDQCGVEPLLGEDVRDRAEQAGDRVELAR